MRLTDLCLVCGGNEWTLVREGGDLCRPAYAKRFKLARCGSCGQVMQNPIPGHEELSAAYSGADYACYRPAWKEPGWPIWKILRLWTTSRRIARLKRYAQGCTMLEVGCGAGDFLLAARSAGWKTIRAIEYNETLAASVRDECGFEVRAGKLTAGLWTGGEFDVVAIWNVLEHMPNPLCELTLAADYLRPGGTVLMNIPSRQGAERGQWFGQYWALLDLPRHIHFFDETTLSRLCSRAGLELTVYDTPFVQSAWCYYRSCLHWASGKKTLRWPRFLMLVAGVTVILPYIALEAWKGRGLEAFAVAVKK